MRTIVCRFKDEAHLKQHLIKSTNIFAPPVALSFLGEFDARQNEALRVVLVVEDFDEQCTVRVKMGPSTTHNTLPCWRHVARIEREDRVWIEMMLQKLATISRVMAA